MINIVAAVFAAVPRFLRILLMLFPLPPALLVALLLTLRFPLLFFLLLINFTLPTILSYIQIFLTYNNTSNEGKFQITF